MRCIIKILFIYCLLRFILNFFCIEKIALEIHNWLSGGHAKMVNVQKPHLSKQKLNGCRNQKKYLIFFHLLYCTYKQHIFTKAIVYTEKRGNYTFLRLQCLFLVFLDLSWNGPGTGVFSLHFPSFLRDSNSGLHLFLP